ncbi:MAG: hypothetical protein L6R42_011189, partial [Xanthoria sp. 1 TBL-2021]
LVSVVYIVMLPIGVKYGAGIHLWDITKEQFTTFSRRANLAAIVYSPVMCLIKLAILIQLASLFAPIKSRMYWVICALSALTIMFYLASMIFRILQCIPREKIWNPSVPGTCIDSTAGILSSAVVNTISDFVLLILPLNRIWRLQMPQPTPKSPAPLCAVVSQYSRNSTANTFQASSPPSVRDFAHLLLAPARTVEDLVQIHRPWLDGIARCRRDRFYGLRKRILS